MRRPFVERSKILAVVVALACVIVAAVGLKVSEPPGDFEDVPGLIGQPVPLGTSEVIVNKIKVGTTLERNGEVEAETTGAFVVVNLTLQAPEEKTILSQFEMASGQRLYALYASNNISAVPGFQTTNDFVFEVDPQQIDDLTLRIWQMEVVSGYRERAVIHLGITPENAEKWRESAKNRVLEVQTTQDTRVIP